VNIFKIKAIVLAIGLSSLTTTAIADLHTSKAVLDNAGQDRIHAIVKFNNQVAGDLYVATLINGAFYFLAENGQLGTDVRPFRQNQLFSEDITALDFATTGIVPGRYPLYQVVTQPGSDPLNFTNWVGGLSGLSVINFTIGLPSIEHGDLNNDGFADDDSNHDGFHDDDSNHDGLHDDDLNHDGLHDDDSNHDGFHDDDSNHDGFHDDDSNHDGLHDNDSNHDGLDDDNQCESNDENDDKRSNNRDDRNDVNCSTITPIPLPR